MTKSSLLLVAFFCLAAHAYAEQAPKPSKEFQQTFKGCKWGNVKSKTLSIWSFTCDKNHGNVRIEADDSLPGFVLRFQDNDRFPVIQTFTKDKSAPIESILPAIQAASPGSDTDTCALIPTQHNAQRYVLEPTGEAKTKWEANETNGESMDPPCGALGVQYVGEQFFEVMKDHPEIVVYYNIGSEIQIFDFKTLRFTGKK